ncbi:MAG: hypothetical protein LGR52_10990 [Candidatus Thiosymbion ectosymbiont of Robbea hypermnestra]|nr:hypothetical protein [Candidatus Thiosymbion ectosymbiont of Robbea hypermnestra]
MTPETLFFYIGSFLGLFGVLAIAIGVVVTVLIGEGEVRLMDTSVLLKDTKVPLGGERE